MGGAHSTARELFFDSVRMRREKTIREMEDLYSRDPTPGLARKINGAKERLAKFREMHERFGRLMEIGDGELMARNSSERGAPLMGEPELVSKIARRQMGEKEYVDLTEGPTLIRKKN
ncbi:MAG TPA: hypothetical protein VLD37_07520 [Candidatus Bilamarchaeum sp.]|nr:hypothetical protein [Candidatus Bilamarchaeum sp.]